MVRAGSWSGCWRRRTSEAGATFPFNTWKTLVECCPVVQKKALLLISPVLDVAPVSLNAEGMVPSSTSRLRRRPVSRRFRRRRYLFVFSRCCRAAADCARGLRRQAVLSQSMCMRGNWKVTRRSRWWWDRESYRELIVSGRSGGGFNGAGGGLKVSLMLFNLTGTCLTPLSSPGACKEMPSPSCFHQSGRVAVLFSSWWHFDAS